jgi:hypothetical protein
LRGGLVEGRGLRIGFGKDKRGKHEEVGILALPGLLRQARFHAHLFKESVPIPTFFRRHLRQQHAFILSLADEQSVLTHMDLIDVLDLAQRGKH